MQGHRLRTSEPGNYCQPHDNPAATSKKRGDNVKHGILSRLWVWLLGMVLGAASASVQATWGQMASSNRPWVIVGLVVLAIYTAFLIRGTISIEVEPNNERQ